MRVPLTVNFSIQRLKIIVVLGISV